MPQAENDNTPSTRPDAAAVIGRLVLHPRRHDRLCVASGRHVLASFARGQNRAAVTGLLLGHGYVVHSDLTVTAGAGPLSAGGIQ